MNYLLFEELCKSNGTTRAALSRKLGISKSNMNNWKNGSNPSVEVLCKLADELNCTTDSLLGRESPVNSINNFGNNNVTYGENSDIRVTNGTDIDETGHTILEMLNNLSLKDRSELILMIYKFYEEHQKESK